jgi:hypothetical protein
MQDAGGLRRGFVEIVGDAERPRVFVGVRDVGLQRRARSLQPEMSDSWLDTEQLQLDRNACSCQRRTF